MKSVTYLILVNIVQGQTVSVREGGCSTTEGKTTHADTSNSPAHERHVVGVQCFVHLECRRAATHSRSASTLEDFDTIQTVKIHSHSPDRVGISGVPGVAATFHGEVAPVVHKNAEYIGNILGRRRLDAAGRVNLLLLRVPDGEVVIARPVEGRSKSRGKLRTLKACQT